ncbi:FHA domain-containing protein [Phototrophicus methaneseepsis]|uniref:FHA domain-containing protein n=1 Tax=Phototrophicus methaneseepsis TaxID=2710758 RepID=A0A7S8IGN6_9CHLR|nr:FHA domain-containing protein [Phototrophicus methaneseepsis]QPC84268.1 FHA domain-containing protein [Phototrophicus methaneseepsis]
MLLANSPYLVLPTQQQFTLHTSTITIGRDHGNMVVLRDLGVSDYHARLVRRNNGYVLEDAGSGYGISVNGRPIYTPTALQDGDEIQLGTQRLIYYGNGRARPGIEYGYFLRVRTGPLSGHRIDLNMTQTCIGRDHSNGIVIDDKQISRRHVLLTLEEDGYAIEDLHSTNGTFINGHRVTNPRLLEDGDVITLGPETTITYERAPMDRPDPRPLPHVSTEESDLEDTSTGMQMTSLLNETSTYKKVNQTPRIHTKSRPMGHDIFLSYCHRDTEIVSKLVQNLEAAGFNLWVDWQDLQPGTPEWDREIKNALSSAKAVITVLSPDAEESVWVARELAMAEMLDQRIYPVLVRGNPIDAIPLRLITHQFVDVRFNYDRGINSLIQTLKHELGR